MLLARIELLSGQITAMDDNLKPVTVEDPCFQHLSTVPGVRYTLGLTIYYEVATIDDEAMCTWTAPASDRPGSALVIRPRARHREAQKKEALIAVHVIARMTALESTWHAVIS